ncbi:hypothetical protein [Streptomyces sp. NBC_00557]|uniref:hypothetical protein n=1 Tax=Streptomyces sp. NBC_00557 TaxID=2975776 RepID=UPI002E82491D|nr:hypothetical protein [Streptomyces sp. NBC_00557]WUC33731.1 hypothetical protein OG956_05660 [Streptomyces sp. NBC_00557]
MHGTQPSASGVLLPKGMRVTVLGLIAGIAGLVTGIFAGTVGGLSFYLTCVAGAGAAFAVFTAGMSVLAYLRE